MQQLFCISSINSDSSVKNVQLLRQIIPQSLVSRESYRPFRFYENVGSTFINPLNYYIITPHYLILLKKDLSVAYIQQNTNLIDVYSDHFKALMEHCEPLVFLAASVADLFDISNSLVDPNGNLYLMSQPCFGRYYTPEIIHKYYKAENSPMTTMAEAAMQHASLLQTVEKNFCTVFSEKGLQYFIETGIVAELPPEYISAAEVKDRIYLLTRLRNDIADGKVTGLIARPSLLRLPDYLTLSMDSNGNAYFDTTSTFPRGAFYCNIHISEKSICQAFRDFFTSLSGSHLVYSKEETLRMLDEGLRKLSGKSPLPG
ncbi:MAG: hypothetical protein LUC90_01290 [Lachnospiraceae bacterium]|nr:hypothetical protein [Lachnospiraceae bacterium]